MNWYRRIQSQWELTMSKAELDKLYNMARGFASKYELSDEEVNQVFEMVRQKAKHTGFSQQDIRELIQQQTAQLAARRQQSA